MRRFDAFVKTTLVGGFFVVLLGFVFHASRGEVERLDCSMGAAVNCIVQWGAESREVFGARR